MRGSVVVGALHLFFVLLFQHSVAVDIEKVRAHLPHVSLPTRALEGRRVSHILQLAGWLRMFFIYTIAGLGGWLTSAVFTPYQVSRPDPTIIIRLPGGPGKGEGVGDARMAWACTRWLPLTLEAGGNRRLATALRASGCIGERVGAASHCAGVMS